MDVFDLEPFSVNMLLVVNCAVVALILIDQEKNFCRKTKLNFPTAPLNTDTFAG